MEQDIVNISSVLFFNGSDKSITDPVHDTNPTEIKTGLGRISLNISQILTIKYLPSKKEESKTEPWYATPAAQTDGPQYSEVITEQKFQKKVARSYKQLNT